MIRSFRLWVAAVSVKKILMSAILLLRPKKKNTCVSGNLTDPTLFSAKVPSQNFFLSFFPTPSPLKKLKKCQFPPSICNVSRICFMHCLSSPLASVSGVLTIKSAVHYQRYPPLSHCFLVTS